MSLKVEQVLDDCSFAEDEPRIYTTGAYLVPLEIKSRNKTRYVWIVDEFQDDTYICGEGEMCSSNIYAKNIESLLNEPDDE